MYQIVISLPVGFFVYYNVFQIHFYSQVNILAIYLALGIGADSVFVMSDCWHQSRSDTSIKTTQGRLNFALDRTVKACLNTTLTTVASFLATSLTPVMPIHCFAMFAAIVLLVNYAFIALFGPTVMMIYHVHFSDLAGCCCCCGRACSGNCGKYCGASEPVADEHLVSLRYVCFEGIRPSGPCKMWGWARVGGGVRVRAGTHTRTHIHARFLFLSLSLSL